MESLEEKVKQALAQCGWNGSKRQEGIEALEQLDLFGFYLFPAARIFVEQFGGMQMKGAFLPPRSDVKKEMTLIGWRTPANELAYCEPWFLPTVEVIQLQRDELLIEIGNVDHGDRYWSSELIYWSENGKVYGETEGQFEEIAPNLFDFFAQFFGLKEEYRPYLDWNPDKNYEDYALADKIEAEMNQETYVSYAQKRFVKNGDVPDPIESQDAFTQWMLSMG